MFGNTEYSMLFRIDTLVENPVHALKYYFRDGNAHRTKTERFESFAAIEKFTAFQCKRRKIFSILPSDDPAAANYGEIIEYRSFIRSILLGEEHIHPTAAYTVPKRAKPPQNPEEASKKEPYAPFDDSIPEGEDAKQMFLATEFTRLQRNFTLVTKKDPFTPANRTVKLRKVWSTGIAEHIVSQDFWLFALDEFEAHQRARVLRGEESSNCFKAGASKYWEEIDHTSLEINAVVLPPKCDFYMPALGTQ